MQLTSAELLTISSIMMQVAGGRNTSRTCPEVKANGVHYTPPELAGFLAEALVARFLDNCSPKGSVKVLDPACGDGELLLALLRALPAATRERAHVSGFDKDEDAVAEAVRRLEACHVDRTDIRCADFLAGLSRREGVQLDLGFDGAQRWASTAEEKADLIISNPPYVRTQVLGASQAGTLARQFGLTGRVDLYHAFVVAMSQALKPDGFLGLLTSNRFLFTQAGASLRAWLLREYDPELLIDLGDTKLFDAAVLPAILVARKRKTPAAHGVCVFRRVYETEAAPSPGATHRSVLAALSSTSSGTVDVAGKRYRIESGTLRAESDPSVPWILCSAATEKWLGTIRRHTNALFGDLGDVKVGIKTTADRVFIREDWESLPAARRPESALLHPLVTHHVAARWSLGEGACGRRRVLYPYLQENGRRKAVDFAEYPRTGHYLESKRSILENRRYVIESGRAWFEIWVPHNPSAWSTEKLAFPDISEGRTFFLCPPGWIVNGDCYWISTNASAPAHTLNAMLAVANSSFALRYYDVLFHNKLYAGRRRFMSQYVRRFPMPESGPAMEMAAMVTHLLAAKSRKNEETVSGLERELDDLVWHSFGLAKEIGG